MRCPETLTKISLCNYMGNKKNENSFKSILFDDTIWKIKQHISHDSRVEGTRLIVIYKVAITMMSHLKLNSYQSIKNYVI